MEWIEDAMSEDAFESPRIDDLDDFIGGNRRQIVSIEECFVFPL